MNRGVPHVAIFAALQWECRPILRHLRGARRSRFAATTVWTADVGATRVTLVKTGIGLARAAEAARALGRSQPFDAFLSSGCAGALAAHLGPGDIVIADAVRYPEGEAQPVHPAQRQRAIQAAERAGLRPHAGSLLSSPTVLASPEEKRAAAASGAIAVEMESAAIAAAAAELGVPFGAVRSILDRAETQLENSGRFVDPASGSLRPAAVAGHLLRHPTSVLTLLETKKMMDAAEASLDRFFRHFLAL